MIWKILVLAAVVGLAWTLLTRKARGVPSKKRVEHQPETPLVKCRACGIYLPAGTPCTCRDRNDA